MAAVAAEPRAAGAPPTVGDGTELNPDPAPASVKHESDRATECSSVTDLVPLERDGDAAQERVLGRAEERDRPDAEATGKALAAAAGSSGAVCPGESGAQAASSCHQLREPGTGIVEPSLSAEAPAELTPQAPFASPQLASSLEPAASSPSSLPAPSPTTDSGPRTGSPALPEPPEHVMADSVQTAALTTGPSEAEGGMGAPQCGLLHCGAHSEPEAVPNSPEAAQEDGDAPGSQDIAAIRTGDENRGNGSRCFSPAEPAGARAPERTFDVDSIATESQLKPEAASSEPAAMEREPESVAQLVPGSEVRVCLDHIIDDALVVSFHLGEKIFSGVLMDLNKRFGPYGIPVTIFPNRDYRDKSDSMQLKTEPFQLEIEKEEVQDSSNMPTKEPKPAPELSSSSPSLWTSKPPPLFQEGVPYPPPLFIRDTYNQSIPQPPPRKIKRPKRRLYREEPTSIMNAIKLRPRQVLCDKCKGTVAGDKREVRRDCRGDDTKRRRNESMAAGGKRPRSEEKGRGAEVAKRQAPTVGQVKGGAAGNRVVRGVSAVSTSTSRVQLNTKKVLQSKNVDHSKAREVLKMAKAQKRQRNTVTSSTHGKTTRASSLRDAHQKVHFTRRLHQISGSGGGGPGGGNPLPPRIRIKPQRYRNEENHPSTFKPAGTENVLESVVEPNLPLACCPSTHSSSSFSSCSAGEPSAVVEIESLALALEPGSRPRSPSSSQPDPELEPSSQPETVMDHRDAVAAPEQQRGGVVRRGRPRKRGRKPGGAAVCTSLNRYQPDSSNASIYSVDSADDLKSSNSECSSTETVVFPAPGVLRLPSLPGPSATAATCSRASKEGRKHDKSLKARVFSKNVSKCITLDSRTVINKPGSVKDLVASPKRSLVECNCTVTCVTASSFSSLFSALLQHCNTEGLLIAPKSKYCH
ncbi:PWWP domain-containing protein 2A-like [Arapaima gigas]